VSPEPELTPIKRALLELRDARARLDALERQRSEPIAIIGLGCRFPGGAHDPESYWRVLRDGVDTIREIPRERWDADALYDPSPEAPGKMATRWGGFVEDVDQFDADFFGISPREATTMDPQQRLLLEVAWQTLEHAGQPIDRLNGSATGVFVGLSTNDYAQLQLQHGDPSDIDVYFGTGGAHSVVSGRLSYLLGLRGPSLSVDTACSSSLVAIHLACRSLRMHECRLAIAGGVNVILLPELTMALSKARMMAADGRCKAFDAAADGFVRAEGCGLVALKRLSDAVADRDRVLAVIRGSAVNQDGRSSGLTAPNGPSQTAVIRAALEDARLAPADIDYVEAHGTGTALGDPIEAQALGAAFSDRGPGGKPLEVGSVKTNIGHLEGAAGVAGLIKVVLSLQHGTLPAHLHLTTPSPHIPWSEIPVVVPTERRPWPIRSGPRRAGVSSFGFSGTNAHVIVEEGPTGATDTVGPVVSRPSEVLALSAKTATALRTLAGDCAARLEQPGTSWEDFCFTANTTRSTFNQRLAIVATNPQQLREALSAFSREQPITGAARAFAGSLDTPAPGVVFLFTGQGSQYAGMGRALYDAEPVFRDAIDACAAIADRLLDRRLTDILFSEEGQSSLEHTSYAQPALFALEYALAQLWRNWGIEPAAVIGHSLGEDVAACVAGVFSVAEALPLIIERGRLMQELADEGGMLAVFADETAVRATLDRHAPRLSIAALNAPTNVVVSGRCDDLARVASAFAADGVRTRDLAASRAFHSALMDPMLEPYERAASAIHYDEPRIPIVSNVTGDFARPGEISTAAYWSRHVRETVRFQSGLDALARRGYRVFLEIGPSPTLVALGTRCVPDGSLWVASMRKNAHDVTEAQSALAAMYAHGVAVDWSAVQRFRPRKWTTLPNYPFERARYWHPAATASMTTAGSVRWEDAVDAARAASEIGPLDLNVDTYEQRWAALERLTREHIISALQQVDAFHAASTPIDVDTLIARCGIVPGYRSLVARWLDTLCDAHILSRTTDGRYARGAQWRPAQIASAWTDARRTNSDLPALLEYLDRCGNLLVAVIRGEESPLETIFPGGNVATAEFLYNRWALPRYFNNIARAAVQTVVTARWRQPLRILEIGAGTGGTTAALLPVLPAEHTTYCYTDVSDAFLSRAAARFADFPFVQYGRLNIEEPAAAQGYPGPFDLVVAANCVHAVQDLRAALGNIRSVLAPRGMLLLYEVTTHLPWFDMSVALIEGWGRFADDLRAVNPLLDATRWRTVLRDCGFAAVEAFPEPNAAARVLGHHVLIARAPDLAEAPVAPARTPVTTARIETAAVPRSSPTTPDSIAATLAACSAEERREQMIEFVRSRVAQVLRLGAGRTIERRERLMDLGVDSLMAVELRNALGRSLQLTRKIPATLIFDYPTVEAIATFLLQAMPLADAAQAPPGASPASEPASTNDRVRELAEMSEEQVEAMLLQKLQEEGAR